MTNWMSNVNSLSETLRSLTATDHKGAEIDFNRAFEQWKNNALEVRSTRKKVFLVGNGASASMASHIAADLAKNAHIHTEVFSDLSLITAIANDISYEEVFAEPVRRRLTEGDMLVAISSSGQSPNIIKAIKEAKKMGGLVVTLSAMQPENLSRKEGILNFFVPATTYGMAESCHAAILHYWVDQMVYAVQQLNVT